MSEELIINKQETDEEIYKQLLPQIKGLINSDEPVITNLSNITAALKQAFDKISWVGFYLYKEDRLYLGPFQGNTACTVINMGSGVCGSSAEKRETIIVDDVDKFPGHIACDYRSKSEIVVPLIEEEEIFGVLDLDSYQYSSFTETDAKYLELIAGMLTSGLKLRNFEIN